MPKELFEIAKLDDLKTGELTIYADEETRGKMFSKIGYATDKEGFLIDEKTKERVKISNGLELKPKDIKGILAGSHIFIRNIGDLAEELAKSNQLKITPKE